MVSPLATGVVFVLTYTLTQTTVLAATSEGHPAPARFAQYELTAPALGGLARRHPVRRALGTCPAYGRRNWPGTATVVWEYEELRASPPPSRPRR
ncbi:hypothetical protein SVIOM342S_08722 [Streptomyces violaceorubidus]